MTREPRITIACVFAAWMAGPVAALAPADTTSPDTVPDRVAESRRAEHYLRTVSLFSNGEGIHSVPFFWERMEKVFSLTEYVPGLRSAGAQVGVRRWGFVEIDGRLEGVSERRFEGASVAVIRCVVCHGGKAAGRFYPGLGNKNVDVSQLGQDSYRWMGLWARLQDLGRKTPEQIRLENRSLALYRLMGDPHIGNLTQGLVPVSLIKTWFYRVANQPVPATMSRQQVKVPAFWGYGKKEHFGAFVDGMGDASKAGWAAMVEIAAGQSPATVLENYRELQRVEHEIGKILPPPFPYAIDSARARAGGTVFARRCAQCHGTYERDGQDLPVFAEPVFVPWQLVRTDPDRIKVFDPDFNRLIDANPLRSILQRGKLTDAPPGYVAPRLHGIWARFPYLHNGSVPSIETLLRPSAHRPRAFLLRDAGEEYRFDRTALGLRLPAGTIGRARLELDGARGARDVYYVERAGHSNTGHEFGVDLSEKDKWALVEFLKTL